MEIQPSVIAESVIEAAESNPLGMVETSCANESITTPIVIVVNAKKT